MNAVLSLAVAAGVSVMVSVSNSGARSRRREGAPAHQGRVTGPSGRLVARFQDTQALGHELGGVGELSLGEAAPDRSPVASKNTEVDRYVIHGRLVPCGAADSDELIGMDESAADGSPVTGESTPSHCRRFTGGRRRDP